MYIEIFVYFLISFILLFCFAKVSYKLKLVDLPNKRKIHSKATAYTGGISISLILLFALQVLDIFDKNLALILSMSFLISLVGLIDDRYHLNTGGKLSLQIIPVFYLIIFENLVLNNIGDYYYFKLELGTFAVPFTLLCVLFLTNAFNYFDGLDGTLSFTTICVILILFFLVQNQSFNLFLITILLPLGVFLCFNFSILKLPKLFLGDSGSLLLGFIISFILIYLANQKLVHPILLAWSVVIFVYEFLSVNLIRLKNNQNPFKAGQDHLHHILFKKNKSIFITNFLISFINLTLFLIGYFSFFLTSSLISLILYILLFFIFFIIRIKF
ncbi:undecaprenyl/decaprenyl-phosphate alpha-N-acetylglucosaminyl 1-phosphate transferase [Candidatus Pelagibacter sp.]|nr:undecaprenyl/decaprenyl-phosphate alpha-N-acetylglucosaminyl 1-phosphate transferase [Candidatus Pelagibacter sp.]